MKTTVTVEMPDIDVIKNLVNTLGIVDVLHMVRAVAEEQADPVPPACFHARVCYQAASSLEDVIYELEGMGDRP